MSNAFLGYTPFVRVRNGELVEENDDGTPIKKEERIDPMADKPKIRLNTRNKGERAVVTADDFARNRTKAMKRLTTSRYGATLKYNLGGYIPAAVIRKDAVKERDEFAVENYIDFLRVRKSDFILDLLVDEEKEIQLKKKEDLERMKQMKSEEEKKFYEQLREKKRLEREKMLAFTKGKWNPGLLNYLAELHDRDLANGFLETEIKTERAASPENEQPEVRTQSIKSEVEIKIETPLDLSQAADNILMTSEKDFGSALFNENDEFEQIETESLGEEDVKPENEAASKKPETPRAKTPSSLEQSSIPALKSYPLRPADSLIDIPAAQAELESIWMVLKMPLDQKLDMAIKYSSPKFALKLDMV